jgi:rhamnogalacturonyl hydrolase YesR
MKNVSIALADSILARFPNPDDIPWKIWNYVQGYWLSGFDMLWKYTGDRKYFDYIRRPARPARWQHPEFHRQRPG